MEAAIEEEQHVLIDLPAQSERFLDRWIEDNGIIEMCEESELTLVYWYVTDDGRDSVQLLDRFLGRYAGTLRTVVVRNHGRGRDFSELDALPALADVDGDGLTVIDLPALHGPTLHKIDSLDFSFWAAKTHKDRSAPHLGLMERQRTKVWLKKAYAAFDTALG
jgi:hypothetical protein